MVKRSRKLCNNDAALTACKKIMYSLILSSVPKLNSVLGFRPTDDELAAIVEAERATGRTRSDILRACFHAAAKAVVRGMSAERDAALAAFETALHESPSPYKPNPPPKRKAG